MNTNNPSLSRGFTLIEVLIALAILSSALLLIVSASRNALALGAHSRSDEQIQNAIFSKYSELTSTPTVSKNLSGILENVPGWTWNVRLQSGGQSDLNGLQKIEFTAAGPSTSGQASHTYIFYRYQPRAREQASP